MAIISGIGEALYVNQFDLSGDIGAFSAITANRNLQDTTTIQKAAMGRTRLLRDGSIGYNAFFDVTAGQEHPVLGVALPSVSALWTWASGLTLGSLTASLVAIESDYPMTRGQDGSVTIAATAEGNGFGTEWGVLLTAGKQTFASAAAGTAIDDGAATAFGLAAYLHVISLASGSATVAIQDSADNSSFANVTGGVFTAATGATSQRLQTGPTAAVRRYARVNVTGTFSNLVAVVAFGRFLASSVV
jgi:hypothetical protein